jgi:hypothetical protein
MLKRIKGIKISKFAKRNSIYRCEERYNEVK